MAYALVVPGETVLVGIRRVVLLGHEVHEQAVGQRLVPVRMNPGNVDRDAIVVADVVGERLAGRPVEDDDTHRAGQADEYVVLTPLVVVQTSNDTRARAGEVRLLDRFRKRARSHELGEPS